MSRLDQAFIKAYRKRDQAHAPPPAPKARAFAPAKAEVAAASSVGAAGLELQAGVKPVAEAPPPPIPSRPSIPPGHRRVDPAHAELQPHSEPHLKRLLAVPAVEPVLQAQAAKAAPAAAAAPAAPATGSPKPPPQAPKENKSEADKRPSEETPHELRAAFEVDRFLWPEACKNLMAAAPEEYRRMAAELLEAGRGNRKLFLVTSLVRGEGRTLLTLCLGQALIQQKAKVVMMDGDIGHPQLARQLKLLPSTGWDETLQSSEPVTESWIESVADGAVLVPLCNPADERDWRIDIGRLEQTVELLCSQHDVVLVDAGPLDDLASRELMSWLAGAVKSAAAIVVRDVRSLSPGVLEEVEMHLAKIGVGRWDVAENFI